VDVAWGQNVYKKLHDKFSGDLGTVGGLEMEGPWKRATTHDGLFP
jgi:hypothetical protein